MGWSVGLSPATLHGSTGWITDHRMPSREVAMHMHALNVCSSGKNATNVSDRTGLTCAAKNSKRDHVEPSSLELLTCTKRWPLSAGFALANNSKRPRSGQLTRASLPSYSHLDRPASLPALTTSHGSTRLSTQPGWSPLIIRRGRLHARAAGLSCLARLALRLVVERHRPPRANQMLPRPPANKKPFACGDTAKLCTMFACPGVSVNTTNGCLKWRPSFERMPKTTVLSRPVLKATHTADDVSVQGNVRFGVVAKTCQRDSRSAPDPCADCLTLCRLQRARGGKLVPPNPPACRTVHREAQLLWGALGVASCTPGGVMASRVATVPCTIKTRGPSLLSRRTASGRPRTMLYMTVRGLSGSGACSSARTIRASHSTRRVADGDSTLRWVSPKRISPPFTGHAQLSPGVVPGPNASPRYTDPGYRERKVRETNGVVPALTSHRRCRGHGCRSAWCRSWRTIAA
eukprot:scaffold126469_cov90-Phaeocystis_antarctica.AAC.5